MASSPGNQRQVPDQAILDAFNKQIYLGNSFVYSAQPTIGGTSETPLVFLSNPASNGVAGKNIGLFFNLRKMTALTASHSALFNFYSNPTISVGVQTIVFKADSSGNLNSKYFLLNGPNNTDLYYVWFNINSAGVDPAIAGRTGIRVSGATNVTAATLGAAAVTAINAAASADFTATGTTTVTLTNTAIGPFTAAVDGTAGTTFTFAVTQGSSGTVATPVNFRPASPNVSQMFLGTSPSASANGTLMAHLMSANQSSNVSQVLVILDPGQSMLMTVTASNASDVVAYEFGWFEN